MSQGYAALTQKEKQTLRLIVRGHDAKSIARHLGLSVHTVNERLRDARRKMAVSSSREAARRVFETEGEAPNSFADNQMGEAGGTNAVTGNDAPDPGRRPARRAVWTITGVALMSLTLGILALASFTNGAAPFADTPPSAAAAQPGAQASDAARAARDWLELGDEARWDDGWRATGASFRQSNSSARWAEVSAQVRTPLGAVRSRTLLSQESVPAPPAGVEVVKFRTDFANKAGAIETVSLAREDGAWKVVGIYLD